MMGMVAEIGKERCAMGRFKLLILSLLILIVASSGLAQAASGPVIVLRMRGVINPFSARYLERGLRLAAREDARALVIILDTPGGLETAMRDMVQSLLESPVPTIVYVSPGGARATSAGMFILLAADVAAMAPATHVGAAHPVSVGGEIDEESLAKAASDASALVRSLASRRGRNVEWAELAVRENLSVTAEEALELNVIDLVAEDRDDLLRQLGGPQLGDATLDLGGAMVQTIQMNLGEQFFHAVTDPNIAYLLLSLGTLFLLAELADPGLSVAGVGTVLCYVVAFMGLGSLSVNWAGIALLVLSMAFFITGLFTDTELVVTIVGTVPFVLGSLLLFAPFRPLSPATPAVRVSPWLIGVMALSIVGFNLLVLRAILAAIEQPPQSGAERLIGQQGRALSDLTPTGQVRVDLQDWSAVTVQGEIRAGDVVQVVDVVGVRLQVAPLQTVAEAEELSSTNEEV